MERMQCNVADTENSYAYRMFIFQYRPTSLSFWTTMENRISHITFSDRTAKALPSTLPASLPGVRIIHKTFSLQHISSSKFSFPEKQIAPSAEKDSSPGAHFYGFTCALESIEWKLQIFPSPFFFLAFFDRTLENDIILH